MQKTQKSVLTEMEIRRAEEKRKRREEEMVQMNELSHMLERQVLFTLSEKGESDKHTHTSAKMIEV